MNGMNRHPRSRRLPGYVLPGFTLIEIMVVIVIILLMLGMAVPVLHVITGSQSEAGATNIIASMLGRARSDAIGLQRPVGVAFIYNPSTQVQTMAEVEIPDCQEWTAGTPTPLGTYVKVTKYGVVDYYVSTQTGTSLGSLSGPPSGQNSNAVWRAVFGQPLDIRQDTDLVPLPAGIAVQTICNCSVNGSARTTDGYLSVGVILFDGQGRLTSVPYGIAGATSSTGTLPTGPNHVFLSQISGLNYAYPQVPGVYNNSGATQFGVPSQFGLVVFQRNAFSGQGFPTIDPTYLYPTSSLSGQYSQSQNGSTQTKAAEDTWMDTNATPLLINRYTGTLIRGE